MIQVYMTLSNSAPPYIILAYTATIISLYIIILSYIRNIDIKIEMRNLIELYFSFNGTLLFATCFLAHGFTLARLLIVLPEWWDLIIKILLVFIMIAVGILSFEFLRLHWWYRIIKRI